MCEDAFFRHPPQPPAKHAYILQKGVPTDLGPTTSTGGIAWDINSSGVVVGGSNSVSVGAERLAGKMER